MVSDGQEEDASKAYEKFLAQYAALYAAGLPPEEPVDQGDGALAAFDELLDAQASEVPETLDVVM